MQVQETAVQTDRIWTVPNILSMLRLALIPVFIWLAVWAQQDLAAAIVLAVGGITDYLDGAIARRTHQISRLGQLLDPIADRASTFTVMVVFLIRGIFPWWFVVLLLARDLMLAIYLGRLRKLGVTGLPVNFVGKLATFNLLIAFPLLMAGAGSGSLALVARVLGWAAAGWGAGLYWYSAVLYVRQARGILATGNPGE